MCCWQPQRLLLPVPLCGHSLAVALITQRRAVARTCHQAVCHSDGKGVCAYMKATNVDIGIRVDKVPCRMHIGLAAALIS